MSSAHERSRLPKGSKKDGRAAKRRGEIRKRNDKCGEGYQKEGNHRGKWEVSGAQERPWAKSIWKDEIKRLGITQEGSTHQKEIRDHLHFAFLWAFTIITCDRLP